MLVFAASGDADSGSSAFRKMPAPSGIPVERRRPPGTVRLLHPSHRQPRAARAIAIGTEGAGPVLRADGARPDRPAAVAFARAACRAGEFLPRRRRTAGCPRASARRRFWSEFFAGAPARAIEAGDQRRRPPRRYGNCCRARPPRSGHIALVGAGPGAEDLLDAARAARC